LETEWHHAYRHLTISKSVHNHAVIFKLSGDLMLEQIADLRKAFWEAMHTDEATELVLDLSDLNHLDSSGMSLLVSTKNSISKLNGKLVLVGLSKPVYQFFEQTHLHHYFDIRHRYET